MGQATLWALDVETGETLWETKLDHSGNGGIRGILLDGDTLVATGYTDGFEGGCLFINEEAPQCSGPLTWRATSNNPRLSTSTPWHRELGSEQILCAEDTWWPAPPGRTGARTMTRTFGS